MATKLYHNPRCSKSRGALQLLEERDEPVEMIKYLETPPDKEDMQEIIELLGINPIELVRTKEDEWKESFKGKELTDNQIIEAMINYPKLIQRPIVIKNQQAVIGRPPKKVLDIL